MIPKKVFMIFAAGLAMLSACNQSTKNAPKGETYYETLEVALCDRTLSTGYSAAISGVQTVEIRPQVSGMITEILIEEGENVRKGQVLFVIQLDHVTLFLGQHIAVKIKQQGNVHVLCHWSVAIEK